MENTLGIDVKGQTLKWSWNLKVEVLSVEGAVKADRRSVNELLWNQTDNHLNGQQNSAKSICLQNKEIQLEIIR